MDDRPIRFEISAIRLRVTPLTAHGRRFVEALAAHVARQQEPSGLLDSLGNCPYKK